MLHITTFLHVYKVQSGCHLPRPLAFDQGDPLIRRTQPLLALQGYLQPATADAAILAMLPSGDLPNPTLNGYACSHAPFPTYYVSALLTPSQPPTRACSTPCTTVTTTTFASMDGPPASVWCSRPGQP
jgi:hypothetical protein